MEIGKEVAWDGSFLGEWKTSIRKDKVRYGEDTFIRLQIDTIEFWAIARKIEDKLPCIIDEIKVIFGLVKLGTHSIKIGAKMYLLIRPVILSPGETPPPNSPRFQGYSFALDIPLNEIMLHPHVRQNHLFKQQVQETYAFREIVGLHGNTKSDVRIRFSNRKKSYYFPISFRETFSILETGEIALPGTILEKWFEEVTIRDVIKRLFGATEDPDFRDERIAEIRANIERIVCRIDKEFIWISVYIIDRILIAF